VRITRLGLGLLTAVTIGIGAFAVSGTANAGEIPNCENTSGILICVSIDAVPNVAVPSAELGINPGATKATGCKFTVWGTFLNGSKRWNGSKKQADCRGALPSGGGAIVRLIGETSATTAKRVYATACVDLYYNGSSHSGLQQCALTDSVPI
jgi:hypothetical protein